ncbi:hypothetical protein EJ06DRAFT_140143 [Trichodelitschia bisporula]|uniref:Uncharacterized protein n=1 Tax=Trichodelitschia bisporula TaxID=703511 RepID=A0A6G1HPZ6_9PEZI|nr:hypothetical protein EJ06DRAFT_140143 [Trichodelitschia bisporula]
MDEFVIAAKVGRCNEGRTNLPWPTCHRAFSLLCSLWLARSGPAPGTRMPKVRLPCYMATSCGNCDEPVKRGKLPPRKVLRVLCGKTVEANASVPYGQLRYAYHTGSCVTRTSLSLSSTSLLLEKNHPSQDINLFLSHTLQDLAQHFFRILLPYTSSVYFFRILLPYTSSVYFFRTLLPYASSVHFLDICFHFSSEPSQRYHTYKFTTPQSNLIPSLTLFSMR